MMREKHFLQNRFSGLVLGLTLLLCFFVPVAQAQDGVLDKIQSGLDGVVRGLDYVGQKAEDWIGPGLGLHEEEKADFSQVRTFRERHPVGPAPMISLSNEFGRISVETWEDRVVEVLAEIVVGAESDAKAAEIAEAISIQVDLQQDFIEVQTLFADTRRDSGLVAIEVNYTLRIPTDASLIADNFFGDTIVRGVGGVVALEAQYGAVELYDIQGPVKIRTHGEFPVKAQGLAQGGAFQLHGAQADFSQLKGELQINNFRGNVHLEALGQEASVDVVTDSGSILLDLAPEDSPDLSASVLYGELQSDLPIAHAGKGNKQQGRSSNPASRQRVMLSASFGNIQIRQQVSQDASTPQTLEGAKPFNDTISRVEEAQDGLKLALDATIGDIRFEGIDEDLVRIQATRIVWLASASDAPAALEALALQVLRNGDEMRIDTVTTANMKELQCSAWRVNLSIQCPRTTQLSIHAENGFTTLEGLGEALRLSQNQGAISATHCKGSLYLDNKKGDITVEDCGGEVEAHTRYGALLMRRTYGKVAAHVDQGRTVIEAPQGEVFVRNKGGDVRILALAGIGGSYDVLVEEGGLSMVMAPESSATLFVKTEGGTIHTGIPLDGRINRESREFQGRLNDGEHQVRLETHGGDIYLD